MKKWIIKIIKRIFGAVKALRKQIKKAVEVVAKHTTDIRQTEESIDKLRRLIRDNPDDLRMADWRKNLRNLEEHLKKLRAKLAEAQRKLNELRDELDDLLS